MRSAALCLIITACVLDSDKPAEDTPLQELGDALEDDLEANGLQVARGDRWLFTIDDCDAALRTLGNCLGNNPAAPYVLPTVPLWPDEFVDEDMREVLGPNPGDTWWTWRLDEREALVLLVELPPPGRYFGLQTFVWSRVGEVDPTDEIYQRLDDPQLRNILFTESPNPDRVLTFASIGDSINDVTIERQSGEAFGTQRYFIVTADEGMARTVTDALLGAGVSDPDHIFVERVSTDLVQVGLDESADDLVTLLRDSLPDDEAAGEAWREELPLVVYRVRDPSDRPPEPYPVPERDERTAVDERPLESDVEDLVAAVTEAMGEPATVGTFESLLQKVDLVGDHCLARPQNCLGDNPDADYQISPTVSLDAGRTVAVVGTLGTETGNATYTNLAVNRFPELVGFASVSDLLLRGTADRHASTVANTDQLYVYYFARDCGELDPCLEITEEMVPRGDDIKIIQRNYVVQGDARGPDPELVVNPRLIVFEPGR